MKKKKPSPAIPIPENESEAAEWILPLLDKSLVELAAIPGMDFKRAWAAVFFIYMGLHPDDAGEPGPTVVENDVDYPVVSQIEPHLITPCHAESGWPVALIPIAKEALRRYEAGLMAEAEYYCCKAQMAGFHHRNPSSVQA